MVGRGLRLAGLTLPLMLGLNSPALAVKDFMLHCNVKNCTDINSNPVACDRNINSEGNTLNILFMMETQITALRGIGLLPDWTNLKFVRSADGAYEWAAEPRNDQQMKLFMRRDFTEGDVRFYHCIGDNCVSKPHLTIAFARCQRPSN